MAQEKRDILEVLKFELSFLEQGGYGRSVRTPWKPTSVFQDFLQASKLTWLGSDECGIGLSRANLVTFSYPLCLSFHPKLASQGILDLPVPGRTHETRLRLTHGAGSSPRRHFH